MVLGGVMEIFFKRYIVIIFVVLMSHQVARADEPIGQDNLFLSQSQPVLLEDLDSERGRGGVDVTALSKSNARAYVIDNSAANSITGGNYIEDGSIRNNSGITDVVQNSGNNVIIQNSTVVTVTFVP